MTTPEISLHTRSSEAPMNYWFKWTAIVVVCGATMFPSFNLYATVLTAPVVTNGSTPFNGSFPLSNAVDGTSNDYASQGQGANTFLEMNFGSSVTMDRVIAVTRNSGAPDDRFSQVTYTFSTDNSFGGGDPTATIATNSNAGQSNIYTLSSPQSAQFVRWDVDTLAGSGSNNNTGTTELLFLQTPANTQIITGVTAYNSFTRYDATFDRANSVNGIVGLVSSDYASAAGGTNTFVDFDLGSIKSIAAFDYIDRMVEKVSSFDLIFANDSAFSSVITTKSYSKGSALTKSDTFASVSAQYVRFDVTGVVGGSVNVGINEMIFYSAVPEPHSLAMMIFGSAMLFLFRGKRRVGLSNS